MLTESRFRAGVVELIRRAETRVPPDYRLTLLKALRRERSRIARLQLYTMLENLRMAEEQGRPICQDTGTFTFFVKTPGKLPFDVGISIRRAVVEATREIPLRANFVDPLSRKVVKSGHATVHLELWKRKALEVELLIKGAGTENFSRLLMMRPTATPEEITESICEVISAAGGKICPPVAVGVGLGGDSGSAVLLAKRALLRPLDRKNPEPRLAELEGRIEREANSLRIGPVGLGGRTTVLRVFVESAPCHTATLPVGVVFQCWPGRRGRAVLRRGRLEVVEP